MAIAILLVQVASTWAMVGVIWLVQLCQYPLFGAVGPASFPGFHAGHGRRISLVVVPSMLLELGSAATLFEGAV